MTTLLSGAFRNQDDRLTQRILGCGALVDRQVGATFCGKGVEGLVASAATVGGQVLIGDDKLSPEEQYLVTFSGVPAGSYTTWANEPIQAQHP